MQIGSRIGLFEVAAPLGAGGMGEVYRGRDTRLGRDVALKVLSAEWAADAQRRARLDREARVLASLNHPNIATLYGVEESPDGLVLVMELVDGTTLANRIALGDRFTLTDALKVARQVATGLEAAHERGIIHRDLKPSNIVVRPDGTVKVLDFGLAKAVATTADGAGPQHSTVTLTEPHGGLGPGTPAYMSPEQARGKPADTRADIWAFGCVLYELLTGQRAFAGDHTSDVVARILEREPDLGLLPPDTPAAIRRLLRRCLEKNPQDRLRDIGDARLDIREALDLDADVPPAPSAAHRRPWRAALGACAVLALLALALATSGRFMTTSPRGIDGVARLTMALPVGVSVARGPGLASSVAVSPDGRTVIVAGTSKDGALLYRRQLDRLDATPLAGTERGSSPFFSWDGAWVGFVADGRLKRVPVAGGAAVDITTLSGFPAGASWGPDDHIVFAYGADARLHIVDARGGTAEVLAGGEGGRTPDVLPDGDTVLFARDQWVYAFSRSTKRATRLTEGASPRFAIGHVIVSRGSALLAAPLDVSRHELTGPVVPLVQGVAREAAAVGVPRHYAISRNGTLAYVPGADTYTLGLVRTDGTERRLMEGQRFIQNPQFSPDGRRIAVATTGRDSGPLDIWIHELESGTATRLTFDGGGRPVWMPDNETVTYSHRGAKGGIYVRKADGRSAATQLLPLDAIHWLVGWTPDRRTLAYGVMEGTPSSIMAFRDGRSHRVVGPGHMWGGRLSRDGRWLVYYLLDGGTFAVYVTPFPGADTRWLIAEGTDPAWAPDDNEIYYRSANRLMAARIDKTAGVRVRSQRLVIEPFLPPLYDDYDVHPDGQTLVVVQPSSGTPVREVSMMFNWHEELKRLAAAR